MIRRHTCFTPECDTPGCDAWEDADCVPHFASEKDALDYAVNRCHWTTDGDLLRCEKCTARLQCEQDGHRWWSWGGDPDTGVTNQSCDRCDVHRLVATPASA